VHLALGAPVDVLVPYVGLVDESAAVQLTSAVVTFFFFVPFIVEAHLNLRWYGRATLLFWYARALAGSCADARRVCRAAYKRDLVAARMLVNAGADVSWRNPKTGDTPLDIAVKRKAGPKLRELLAARREPSLFRTTMPVPAIIVREPELLPGFLVPVAATIDAREIVISPDPDAPTADAVVAGQGAA